MVGAVFPVAVPAGAGLKEHQHPVRAEAQPLRHGHCGHGLALPGAVQDVARDIVAAHVQRAVKPIPLGDLVEQERGVCPPTIGLAEDHLVPQAAHPLDAVSVGDIVEVQVLGVDEVKKRISLTMKVNQDKNGK